jgi:hypothetical protein
MEGTLTFGRTERMLIWFAGGCADKQGLHG